MKSLRAAMKIPRAAAKTWHSQINKFKKLFFKKKRKILDKN